MEKEALSPSVGPVGSCGSFFLKDAVRMITMSWQRKRIADWDTEQRRESERETIGERWCAVLVVIDESLFTIAGETEAFAAA